MSKTTREDLVRQVQSELSTYLGSGQYINERELAGALDFSGLAIRDFDRLKRIHFVLSSDVKQYVDKLPNRLGRIHTTQKTENQQNRGEIRGSVDWGQTLRERYATIPTDRSLFVNRVPYTEYQLPENRLLKTFLAIIHRTLIEDISVIDRDWRRERWSDNDIAAFRRRYDRNVHLERINADSNTELSARELTAARCSRQPLYYEAYELYEQYQSLLKNEFNKPVVSSILDDTVIVPDTETLFELYCLFVLLSHLRTQHDFVLLPTDSKETAIALLEQDGQTVHVYHDNSGSLTFRETSDMDSMSGQSGFEYRLLRAREGHRRFLNSSQRRPLYNGRPDLLFEIYPGDSTETAPAHVVIVEIKHTASEPTFSTGVAELFEYLQFAQHPEGNYLLDDSAIAIEGMIFTDGISRYSPQDRVTHVNISNQNGVSVAATIINQALSAIDSATADHRP